MSDAEGPPVEGDESTPDVEEPAVEGDEPAAVAPTETERLVSCYLDATVPEDRRDEIQALVRVRLTGRRGGSRAQVLALVHEVVEERVDIAPVEAGAALIRECGLTPLAASLIVGLNRDELEPAVEDEAGEEARDEVGDEELGADEGPALPFWEGTTDADPAPEPPDDDAMAVLSEDLWTPRATPEPGDDTPPGTSTDDTVRVSPPAPAVRPERYDTWSGGSGEQPSRAIPAVAVVVALLVVAVVAVALVVTRTPRTEVTAPADDDGPGTAETTVPATEPAAGTGVDDGTEGVDDDGTAEPSGGDSVAVAGADGGDARAGGSIVASFSVPPARDDLLWSLTSDGDELFAPTPLVVPPGGTGDVRLLIPGHFVRGPGTYTLRVLAGDEVVVEHDFSVTDA